MDAMFNTIGLMGMVLLLVAYFLQQKGLITAQSAPNLWLNLAGSTALLISLLRFWNLPVFVLECAWALISIYGLVKLNLRKS